MRALYELQTHISKRQILRTAKGYEREYVCVCSQEKGRMNQKTRGLSKNREKRMRLRAARTTVLSQIYCSRTHVIMLKYRHFILEMM